MNFQYNSTYGIPTTPVFDSINNMAVNPIVLGVLSVLIVLYYVFFYSLGKQSVASIGEVPNNGLNTMEIILWGVFVVLILLNGMRFFFDVDIVATIRDLFKEVPEIDIEVTPKDEETSGKLYGTTVPEIMTKKQVYHVPGNHYTYEDAKAVCKAYGGRLANYDEIENAYENGADWCSYGWSDGQMGLFPTQKSKWSELQKIKGHENDCGRPGINGGYISNSNVRFGVNCFGYKPKITSQEADLMHDTPLYPKTKKELDFEKKVAYWKQKIPEILIAPFNHDQWSAI